MCERTPPCQPRTSTECIDYQHRVAQAVRNAQRTPSDLVAQSQLLELLKILTPAGTA